MNISNLQEATLNCLAAQDSHYENAQIKTTTPVAGGYSRINNRFELETKSGLESIILQYSPVGETGLVRVDRQIEYDLLAHLSNSSDIRVGKLITADLNRRFFDSAAYIFKAEPGQPYVEICRQTEEANYAELNRVVAGVGAQVQKLNTEDLPVSIERPGNWKEYIDQQIEFFKEVESQTQGSRPFLRYLAKWLDENRPPEAPLSLVHGDFQISNMLSLPDNPEEAVLVDWELAHIGDPREDLGWFTMVCGAIPPNILQADSDAFYREYRARTGLSEEIINPATSAYFLIISSIRTHFGMIGRTVTVSSGGILSEHYNLPTHQLDELYCCG